ncbi:MAG: hypothetical protein ACOYMS_15210 [Terrimicrobiaceae bacterium]
MLSAGLEKLGHREGALDALFRAKGRVPSDARVRLSLAKLLFRAGRKEESQAELACEANRLMHELGCPLYGQPQLKGAAVRLEELGSPSR